MVLLVKCLEVQWFEYVRIFFVKVFFDVKEDVQCNFEGRMYFIGNNVQIYLFGDLEDFQF